MTVFWYIKNHIIFAFLYNNYNLLAVGLTVRWPFPGNKCQPVTLLAINLFQKNNNLNVHDLWRQGEYHAYLRKESTGFWLIKGSGKIERNVLITDHWTFQTMHIINFWKILLSHKQVKLVIIFKNRVLLEGGKNIESWFIWYCLWTIGTTFDTCQKRNASWKNWLIFKNKLFSNKRKI